MTDDAGSDEADDGGRVADGSEPSSVDAGELDAEFAALVDTFAAEGLPPWHSLSVDAARRIEDDVFGGGDASGEDASVDNGSADDAGGPPAMAAVRDLAIDGPGGDVPIRAYRPESASDVDESDERPGALVFYHGGVFVLGTLDSSDDICRELAARTGCVVLSADYRLAPEHPFPAAVDDAYAVLEWAREYADAFGADPDKVGVAGTSAGGGIAAATALRAAANDVDLAVQALLYPMLSPAAAFGDTAAPDRYDSYREHEDAALLSTRDVAWGWEHYLRSPVDAHNPFAAPARAGDDLLADAAPAVVATAGVDVLRDEAARYANRLSDVGVETTHAHYPTLAHGFCSVTDDVAVADDATDDVAAAIADYVH